MGWGLKTFERAVRGSIQGQGGSYISVGDMVSIVGPSDIVAAAIGL